MQFSDDCRSRALVLMEIANKSPRFKEQALALAESWLTLANITDLLTGLIQDHSTAMMQTIDGVCLRLRVGRQVARCTLRKRSRLKHDNTDRVGVGIRRDKQSRYEPSRLQSVSATN